MRASSAVLTDSAVRLWDLRFPAASVLLHRTRAAYVHVDNLIAYSKRDRDAKVDAYLVCYLPDEVVLLYFLKGELANATVFTAAGRFAAAIPEAMRHLRSEPERAEMAFHVGEMPLLASLYAACQQAPLDFAFDVTSPETIFKTLMERKFTGLIELISNARVNYIRVKEGRFKAGYFAEQPPGEAPNITVQKLFTSTPPEPLPRIAVKAFPGLDAIPVQAPAAMVAMFRHFVWDVTELAEKDLPGDAGKRAERLRQRLATTYDVLRLMGGPRGTDYADPIIEPAQLSEAVAEWSGEFLGELEVIRPKIAAKLLKDAAREHRYQLAAVGFFDRLPWKIEW